MEEQEQQLDFREMEKKKIEREGRFRKETQRVALREGSESRAP